MDLHLHTTFSFLDGYGTIKQVIDRAHQLGRESIAVTDHGNISAHVGLDNVARSKGIKPIFGCELYILPSISENTRKKHHIIVLAKNAVGYRNLLKLVTLGWEHFYYKPTIDISMLFKNQEGLVVLSGCYSSIVNQSVVNGENKLSSILKLFSDNIEHFYVELQPFDICSTVNPIVYSEAGKLGLSCCLTGDVHYVSKGQQHIQKMLYCINQRKIWDDVSYSMSGAMYQMSRGEIVSAANKVNNGIDWDAVADNSVIIADMCNVELPKSNGIVSVKKIDLYEICCQELKKVDKYTEEYTDRLDREFALIVEKNFVDYFIVIYDMVDWAKNNGILIGPSRGSSAGSLVCYALHITEVDPIVYDLPFERFMDESRTDYPDIDIDVEEDGRAGMLDYLRRKYGEDKVGQIATYAEFKGKNSLEEVGKMFQIPKSVINEIKPLVLYRSIAEARASLTVIDSIKMFPKARRIAEQYPKIRAAAFLEGQSRHLSSHAGGFVISDELRECCAVYSNNILSCDKDDAVRLGLLKIDILSLHTLSILKNILNHLNVGVRDLHKIPLDDDKTFDGFNNFDVLGIFQFTGASVRSILGEVVVSNIFHLSDVNALGRPGPIQARITREYISRFVGRSGIEHISNKYDEITKDTFGLAIYQEQVMRLVREIGLFSWDDTNKIRRAMAKSMGENFFGGFKDKFMKGAKSQGYDGDVAEAIWNRIYTFGAWAFSKNHAVGYSILGYWMMYFKQHHPLLFYWASILSERDERTRNLLLSEMVRKGFKLLPPDINRSNYSWTLDEDGVRAGLSVIKGIGVKVGDEIAANRPYDGIEDLQGKCSKRIVNSRVVKILQSSGAIDGDYHFESLEKWEGVDASGLTKLSELNWGANELKKIKVCVEIEEKIIYDIHEEDSVRGINRDYSHPELSKFIVLHLVDDTGTVKGQIDRMKYPKYESMIWDSKSTDLFVVEGEFKPIRRRLVIQSMEKLQ